MAPRTKGSKGKSDPFFANATASKASKSASSATEDAGPPKDQQELELEKLVFGDEEGFEEGLRDYNEQLNDAFPPDETTLEEGEQDGGLESDEGGMDGLDDAAVCRTRRRISHADRV
jgi:hypothetical protein